MFFKKFITHSATSLLMSVIGAFSMILLLSQTVQAADLTVKINELQKGKGHALIALYLGEEGYNSDETYKAGKVKVNNPSESFVFKDLPDGEYAIKMFQDENDNNQLDTNMMGIPNEGYGFSNNVGMFGQPEYKKAKFVVKNDTVIEINLF